MQPSNFHILLNFRSALGVLLTAGLIELSKLPLDHWENVDNISGAALAKI